MHSLATPLNISIKIKLKSVNSKRKTDHWKMGNGQKRPHRLDAGEIRFHGEFDIASREDPKYEIPVAPIDSSPTHLDSRSHVGVVQPSMHKLAYA